MGHIINPLSQRIGYSTFWNSNWSIAASSQNFLYKCISTEDINLNLYLKKLFLYASRRLFGKGLLLVGLKFLRFYDKIILLMDVKLKQLVNLYNAVELTFLNLTGLHTARLKQTFQKQTVIKKVLKPSLNKLSSFTLSYKLKPKFIRRTSKLTPFNSVVTEPDFWSYHWGSLIQIIYLKNQGKRFKKYKSFNLKKNITHILVNYLLLLRWLLVVKKFINVNLHRFYQTLPKFDIIINILSTSALTASFIAKYLSTRLLQKFPLRRLINLIVKQLKIACDNGSIQGFKIACNGRFERRGRATHVWKLVGKNPCSDVNLYVDYSIMLPVLTNSICAVKVWLTKRQRNEKLLII